MKTQKIALKLLVLCPVGYLLALLAFDFFGFDLNWVMLLNGLIGVVLVVLFVFSNVMNYRKFTHISDRDFLECEHRCFFTATQKETLEKLDALMQLQFNSVVLTDKEDDHGYRMYRINSKFRNIYLQVKFNEDQFELRIKPDSFPVVPDSARNYRFLEKLKNELKN